MVNVGLRAYLFEQKPLEQKVQRELWNLNGATYEGYRAYIRYVKDFGFPESGDTTPEVSVSRLPTTESLQAEASSSSSGAALSLVGSLYVFSGMKHVYNEAGCAVHLVKFGRFTADFLAFAAADGCIYIASTSDQPGILQVLRGHTGRVQDLDWSHGNAFLLSCGRDGDLCLWHADSSALVRKWEQSADTWSCPLACCRFHPVNPGLLFVGTVAGEVVALNSSTGRLVSRVSLQSTSLGGVGAACLDLSPTLLVVADSRGGIHLFSCCLHDGRLHPLQQLCAVSPARDRSHEPACLEFVPHSALARGPAALLVDCQGHIQLHRLLETGHQYRWELKSEVTVGSQASHKIRAALAPAMHLEQPEVVAMGGQDAVVHVYDISRHKQEPIQLAQLQGHSAPVLDVSWSFDESLLASCDAKGMVIIWKKEAAPATLPSAGEGSGT